MALMFAYGSNLNLSQMEYRCPDALPVGKYRLRDWRLVFRGVADVIHDEGAVCHGGIWEITPRCESVLDVYEGVRSGMYRKEYVPTLKGEPTLLYVMNSTGIMPPSAGYLAGIRQGYRDFTLPKTAVAMLNQAVRDAWDNKAPSHIERQRRRRTGHPALARRPTEIGRDV